ncbi:hypothetical protein MNBD_GAMMA26-1897 [hydrothermal vent metagenome]|uniref:Methyltransferase domain-containing protein n=1 Tax=hydrothermal vent metagenome TaxID=652676 RepID=A0A3B1BXM8_9ZZZZ
MEKDYIHKIYPRKFKRNDFWSQIKRTINGIPVSDKEIDMIVNQIIIQLELQNEDNVLDLGCGNAALSSRLFGFINRYIGVDFSEYLIEIANEYFRPNESVRYIKSDICSYVTKAANSEEFSKVLCYGAMAYLSRNDVVATVQTLRDRFKNVERIYFGNIPNKSKAKEFFLNRKIYKYSLDDPQSAIGVWWDPDDIVTVMKNIGFTPLISHMHESFYSSSYRFDLTLLPN